jgi:hypothetical protein
MLLRADEIQVMKLSLWHSHPLVDRRQCECDQESKLKLAARVGGLKVTNKLNQQFSPLLPLAQ